MDERVATRAARRAAVLRWRLATAVVAGAALALAFPPTSLLGGWWAIPSLAVLIATFRGTTWRAGAMLGLASGLSFFLVLLDWMRVIGTDAWILVALVWGAAFWALLGAALPRLLAGRWWLATVPLAWVVMEALRARVPWGGFPWGRMAYSQAGTELIGWAAVGGPALLSLVVVAGATAVLALGDAVRGRRTIPAAGLAVLLAGLVLGGAAAGRADWGGPDGQSLPVAIIQGNVPRLGLDFNAQRRAVLDNHVRQTEQLAEEVAAGRQPQPVAVIWPENSSDIDPLRHADAAAQIDRAADAIGVPILVGAVTTNPQDPPTPDGPGTALNVAIVWDPASGPGERYAKRHPVPFGEYLPFRDLLSRFITRFDRIPRDFAAGDAVGVLDVGPLRAGIVICFEVAYDELVRDAVRAGGSVLVVQTNNATYGRTGQPDQQLAISRVQAVASGRTTLVAATSGISAAIDPQGDLRWVTDEFTPDATVASVPVRGGLTPAMHVGGYLELLAALALVGLVVADRLPRPTWNATRGRPVPSR